jgi:hypothetical protein
VGTGRELSGEGEGGGEGVPVELALR